MNSWLKTGKGMVSQIMDVVSPTPQAMPISEKKKKRDVLFTSLNQDSSYICCGTINGFKIFRSKPFEKIFESCNLIPLKIAMVFDKSLIGILTETNNNKNNKKNDIKDDDYDEEKQFKNNKTENIEISNEYKLQLYDIKNTEEIWRIDSIEINLLYISFLMNTIRLVISLESNKLFIFDITNKMKLLDPFIRTYNNYSHIFDLCIDENNSLLAYLDESGKGRIGIIDTYNLQKRLIIKAHDSDIQIIKFNENGTLIASSSKNGTLIRVFSINKNQSQQVAIFRRGTFNSVINCLAFNKLSTLLCCSSNNSNTIHIFNLKIQLNNNINTNNSMTNTVSTINSMTNTVSTIPRSYINIQIKSNQNIMACGFINNNSIVIATENGYFYRYSIDINQNKAKLLSEHSLKQGNIDLDHQTKIFNMKKQQNNIINENIINENIINENIINEQEDIQDIDDNESPESQSPEIFNTKESTSI